MGGGGSAGVWRPLAGVSGALVEGAKRFRQWLHLPAPEHAPLPGEWAALPALPRLLLLRALRPDRLLHALTALVARELGPQYVARSPLEREEALEQDTRAPILFILSAGADPVELVEARADRMSRTLDNGRLQVVSMGEGQEAVAEAALGRCEEEGAWLCLHNLHLSLPWTARVLDDRLDRLRLQPPPDGPAAHFRLFLSTRPAGLAIGVLESCIKVADAAPAGLKAKLSRALALVADSAPRAEESAAPREYAGVVFGVCVVHAVLEERARFGAIGWNQRYHLTPADLAAAAHLAFNYLDTAHRLAWTDLRLLLGGVVYGGHVTDGFDALVVDAYLEQLVAEELLDGGPLLPGLRAPAPGLEPDELQAWVRAAGLEEGPRAVGLAGAAEEREREREGERVCGGLEEVRGLWSGAAGGASVPERAGAMIDDIAERLPARLAPPPPDHTRPPHHRPAFVHVLAQEVERMNGLLDEMARSILELRGGLHGDMQISELMEGMMAALARDQVPPAWEAVAYPSLRPLHRWVSDVVERAQQLVEWSKEPAALLRVTWISGLFMPQALLMAVAQTTARNNGWALDQTEMVAEMTKKGREEMAASARDGVYVDGLFLEGARWDHPTAALQPCAPRRLAAPLPVMLFKAVAGERKAREGGFACPIYKTARRAKTFVLLADVKSTAPPSRWILAGVAMLMEP